jgi:flagellar hook-length control protein FliK
MGRGTATQPTFSIHDASRPAAESASPGRGDSAGPAAGGKEIVSRVKLIQRVSRAFQQLGRNGGTVRMRLAPAELGTVRIEMRVQDNQVSARVVAETDAASQALREHLPDLRLRLESQGMRVERIEVQTESGEPRDARDQEHANRDHGRQQMGDDPRHRQARRPQGGPEAAVRGTGDDVSRAVSRGGAAAPKNASVSGGVDARF